MPSERCDPRQRRCNGAGAFPFEHDLVRKPVPTFRDHALGIHRAEELITDPLLLKKMYVLRRILNPMGTMDAIDFLLDKLRNTKSNAEFFESMNT